MKKLLLLLLLGCNLQAIAEQATADSSKDILQFVFTSDVHYGITRKIFRGKENVSADLVNQAMIRQINTLPGTVLPNDHGIHAGKKTGWIDYLLETGDIANREEPPSPPASISWKAFERDYFHLLTIKDRKNQPAKLLFVPGNHDASNAIGFYREMNPLKDPAAMVGIYNAMLHPSKQVTLNSFDYAHNKVNYAKDIQGIHFVFINIWPDSANRIWLTKDLAKVDPAVPVLLFAHDPPTGDQKHFTNPNGNHAINETDKFENLLEEQYKPPATGDAVSTIEEERGFVDFLKSHPNIKAYFHGHSNYHEFYTYHGPDNDINLPVFRADSPMKGKISSKDETKLSFELISINTRTLQLTARQCLWNTDPGNSGTQIIWGESITISLK